MTVRTTKKIIIFFQFVLFYFIYTVNNPSDALELLQDLRPCFYKPWHSSLLVALLSSSLPFHTFYQQIYPRPRPRPQAQDDTFLSFLISVRIVASNLLCKIILSNCLYFHHLYSSNDLIFLCFSYDTYFKVKMSYEANQQFWVIFLRPLLAKICTFEKCFKCFLTVGLAKQYVEYSSSRASQNLRPSATFQLLTYIFYFCFLHYLSITLIICVCGSTS